MQPVLRISGRQVAIGRFNNSQHWSLSIGDRHIGKNIGIIGGSSIGYHFVASNCSLNREVTYENMVYNCWNSYERQDRCNK